MLDPNYNLIAEVVKFISIAQLLRMLFSVQVFYVSIVKKLLRMLNLLVNYHSLLGRVQLFALSVFLNLVTTVRFKNLNRIFFRWILFSGFLRTSCQCAFFP